MKVKLLPVLLLAGILAGVAVGTTGCVAVGAALADDALSKDDRKEFQKMNLEREKAGLKPLTRDEWKHKRYAGEKVQKKD